VSTSENTRNGTTSNVFVYTKTKMSLRERPSDPRAGHDQTGGGTPEGGAPSCTHFRTAYKNTRTQGRGIDRPSFSKVANETEARSGGGRKREHRK